MPNDFAAELEQSAIGFGDPRMTKLRDVVAPWVERAARVCENEADAVDMRLPDATGGKFAKKFAANGMRGCSALIRKLLSEIPDKELEAPKGWRSIDTAPKQYDGILLSDGTRVSYGGWVSDIDQGAEYEGQCGMAGWWTYIGDMTHPTHWMPLPAPSAQSSEGKP